MPRTLYTKLALMLLLLLGTMGLLYAVISVSATRHYLYEVNQQFNRDLARNLVADRNLVEAGRINNEKLEETFHHYMVINPSIEIYLLDLDGNILAYSADPGKVKRKRVSLKPVQDFLHDAGYPLLGDDPRSHARRKVFSVTPVPTAESPEGYLYVVLRGEEYDNVNKTIEESHFFRLSAWTVAGTLIFGLLAGLIVFHLLTRRLRRLTALMDAFRTSHLTSQERYKGRSSGASDEIDQMGITFNQMADRITSQLQALQQKDEMRRELVAHVSHDLRTPLASLHGYLETLQLKEATITDHQRREYVDIALRQCEHLKRLTMDLLELAKLDAQEAQLDEELFGPAELVQDVVQKFQLQAQQADVELVMQRAGEIPLVSGEISLIERVLENFIVNSLHHTPASGRIVVSIEGKSDSVQFTVRDTGGGIPEQDLPRIFDRFYQAGDKHRGNVHAGLGLAIAKRIIELHGKTIHVESRLNAGTSFYFSLPAMKIAASHAA